MKNICVRRTTKTIVTTIDVNKTTVVETTVVEENPEFSDAEKKAIDDMHTMLRPSWFESILRQASGSSSSRKPT